jgi:nitrite reductase/ring-hydroxylating ferredoxin subunit
MKRADGLYDISRRDLCVMVGLGALGIAGGCVDGGRAIQTGGLDSDLQVDALQHIDATVTGDASTGGACTSTPIDVGLASTFVVGQPVYMSPGFYVVRDAGGLYALTAKCTHEGATTCVGTTNNCSTSGTVIYCPRHGATFSFLGAILSGPVNKPLVHYSVCLMSNGHVGVITSTQVPQTTRLVA